MRSPKAYLVAGSLFATGAVYAGETLYDGESAPAVTYEDVLRRDLQTAGGEQYTLSAGVDVGCQDEGTVTSVSAHVDVVVENVSNGGLQGRSLPTKLFVFDVSDCNVAIFQVLRRSEENPESLLGAYVMQEIINAGALGTNAHGYAAEGRTIASHIQKALENGARQV